jgi:hypothetical protein
VYGVFVVFFVVLAYLGVQPPVAGLGERVSQIGTLFYFGFFLLMPWWSRLGAFKPCPSASPSPRTEGETRMKKLLLTGWRSRSRPCCRWSAQAAGSEGIAWDRRPT